MASGWLPGASLVSGNSTHSPRPSATMLPIFCPSAVTVTVLWGAARPAITMPPSGLIRTISKLGAVVAVLSGAGGLPAAGAPGVAAPGVAPPVTAGAVAAEAVVGAPVEAVV